MAIAIPKLTKQQQQYAVAGVVMVGVLGFVYWKFFWTINAKAIAECEAAIVQLDKDIAVAKETARTRSQIEAQMAELQVRAEEAATSLPPEKSVQDILVTLVSVAKKSEVSVTSFSPGGKVDSPGSNYIEFQYPVIIRGKFHNVGRFLAGLALQERIYNVMNVTFGTADADGTMQVNFTLLSYQGKPPPKR